jgi:uncharacterized protein DUF3237
MNDQPFLEFAFEIRIKVEPGKGFEAGAAPKGLRRMIPITGGSFEGPNIKGTIIAGGYDFQLLRNDNVMEIDARYVLQTDDGALITIMNRGLRHADKEVMQQMANGIEVSPSLYYFRSIPQFETGSEKYDWLNRSVFIANGVRKPAEVIISVFKVL